MINSALCTWVKNKNQVMKAESRVKIKRQPVRILPLPEADTNVWEPREKEEEWRRGQDHPSWPGPASESSFSPHTSASSCHSAAHR